MIVYLTAEYLSSILLITIEIGDRIVVQLPLPTKDGSGLGQWQWLNLYIFIEVCICLLLWFLLIKLWHCWVY